MLRIDMQSIVLPVGETVVGSIGTEDVCEIDRRDV
jgi:hypothetical protein